jgi:hypothetical protein
VQLDHHAYLFSGNIGDNYADFLKEKGIVLPQGTEVVRRTYATFGIDDARSLKRLS